MQQSRRPPVSKPPPTRDYHARREIQERDVHVSKFLSAILRHSAKEEGINISADGWVSINELLSLPHSKQIGLTEENILRIVKDNDKQRFSIKEGDETTTTATTTTPPSSSSSTPTTTKALYIKANQGHSMQDIEVELTKISNASEYPTVVHGTYHRFWPSIKKSGLSKMRRNHIHMAIGEYGSKSVISGMRSSCEIVIYIDIARAMQDGIDFFVSQNKVVLSSGVDGYLHPKYFAKVIDVKKEKGKAPKSERLSKDKNEGRGAISYVFSDFPSHYTLYYFSLEQ
eukprot:TRINITY_DN1201_c0_g3_i3.p1 TRINITY_DN1201_c0_g3~~TRINITY_DN1201_c0_g3_i3.p1  ORF type:complete len:304 (+),score=80.68 TRINITY_DN1201_c0_g3_i3:60-914(+)